MICSKLVLIDVDGTLLNREYRFTMDVSVLKGHINDLERKGFFVGLSSDSAAPLMQEVSSTLGLNGPIVAEKGAVVLFAGKKVCTNPFASSMGDVRREFVRALLDDDVVTGKVSVCVGNVNSLFQTIRGSSTTSIGSDILILVNGSREASFSFYCLEKQDGRWGVGSSSLWLMAEKAIAIATRYYTREDLDIDVNPQYGICILHHRKTCKQNALPYLTGDLSSNSMYMIGDSLTDFHGPTVTHCAVRNASDEYKAKAEYVSGFDVTEGVSDILAWISRQK